MASAPAQSRADLALRAGPLDGLFDKRKTVIITGTSSGLGKQTARALCESGDWYVIMGVRDTNKMRQVAKELRLPENSYEVMPLELESLRSVRAFVKNVKAMGRQIDSLVCNAALYLPNQRSPDFTEDGFERCFQVCEEPPPWMMCTGGCHEIGSRVAQRLEGRSWGKQLG